MDDPYVDTLNRRDNNKNNGDVKPAAKRAKGFCEYCGNSNHLTKKSKKCTAEKEAAKLYHHDTGFLLSATHDVVPSSMPVEDADGLALRDCELMDAMPFDGDYNSDIEAMPLAMLSTDPTTNDNSDDEDDTRYII